MFCYHCTIVFSQPFLFEVVKFCFCLLVSLLHAGDLFQKSSACSHNREHNLKSLFMFNCS